MTTLIARQSAHTLHYCDGCCMCARLPLPAVDIRQAARKARGFLDSLCGFVFGPMERAERLHVGENDEVGTIFSSAWVMVPE